MAFLEGRNGRFNFVDNNGNNGDPERADRAKGILLGLLMAVIVAVSAAGSEIAGFLTLDSINSSNTQYDRNHGPYGGQH